MRKMYRKLAYVLRFALAWTLTAALAGTALSQPLEDDNSMETGHDVTMSRSTDQPALGSTWLESENGWSGVWRRRGTSNIFDATWTKDGERVVAVLTMTPQGGNTVHIYRRDTSSSYKIEVDYTGTIDRNGRVHGTGKVRETGFTFPWTASIKGGDGAPTGDGAPILGTVWYESENGWSGVWRRRGTSNIFDATWTKDGERVVAVLTMTPQGGNTVHIYRRDTSSSYKIEVDYTGTIDRNGRVHGTGKVRETGFTFPWTASIKGGSGAPASSPASGSIKGGEGAPTGDGAPILGTVWYESENGWSGVWRRRGTSNIFDATWTKDGERVVAVLTMTHQGGNTVHIYRRDTVSPQKYKVDYIATIDRNGNVRGTGKVRETGFTFSWTATVK